MEDADLPFRRREATSLIFWPDYQTLRSQALSLCKTFVVIDGSAAFVTGTGVPTNSGGNQDDCLEQTRGLGGLHRVLLDEG